MFVIIECYMPHTCIFVIIFQDNIDVCRGWCLLWLMVEITVGVTLITIFGILCHTVQNKRPSTDRS